MVQQNEKISATPNNVNESRTKHLTTSWHSVQTNEVPALVPELVPKTPCYARCNPFRKGRTWRSTIGAPGKDQVSSNLPTDMEIFQLFVNQ